jgi:hypothetical protein
MKVILGAGLSGLTLATCFKNNSAMIPVLFSKDYGGQMKSPFPLGPRILHNSSNKVIEFLDYLGIKDKPRDFKIGYYKSCQIKGEATERERIEYILKTRGNSNIIESSMSAKASTINGWDMNEINLLNKMLVKIKIVKRPIHRELIDGLIRMGGNDIYSTIDYFDLAKMLSGRPYRRASIAKEKDESFVEQCFYCIKVDDDSFKGYDYIYNLDPEDSVKRMTKFIYEGETYCIYESMRPESLLNEMSHTFRPIKKQIQIVQNLNVNNIKGVTLVGRYAQVDHSVRIDTIINKYWESKV